MLKYSIILIVSTYYMLCISWIIKCLSFFHNSKYYIFAHTDTKTLQISVIIIVGGGGGITWVSVT